MNITQLNALVKIISSNPTDAKALIKLASVDVLKALGDGKYSILLNNKTLTAQSQKQLTEGSRYWTQVSQTKNETPQLSSLIKIPLVLKNLQNTPLQYNIRELQTLLNSPKPENIVKIQLLEQLSNASSKEEFTNTSNLLLSLQNQTMTIPFNYNGLFCILQYKKRYNNKSKKTFIDFYAALELLGPISGLISLEDSHIGIELNVGYEKTKQFLKANMDSLGYDLVITTTTNIEPIFESNPNAILDICI
ncbi:MAG: hypothetical protein L3I99_02685 [Sulfurimonas sp.]|nr:hypothetical protein [Sulfurimonas sp.]